MTAEHAHELPPEREHDVVLASAEVAAIEDGNVVYLTRGGRPIARIVPIDPDQAWFWTPEWQAGEREVDEELAQRTTWEHMSGEEFLASLDADIATIKAERASEASP